MEDFAHGRKVIEFWQVTGDVVSSNKYNETHVTSSGGGGYVGPYGGHVSAPQVHSTMVENHEFWIKTPDGKENPIKLRGVDIPLRVGQKITLISAGHKGSGSGWYSILVNHSAKKHWFINSAVELNRKLGLKRSKIISFLLALCLSYILLVIWAGNVNVIRIYYAIPAILTEELSISGIIIIIIALVIPFVFYIFRLREDSKWDKSLGEHMEKLAQTAYQQL